MFLQLLELLLSAQHAALLLEAVLLLAQQDALALSDDSFDLQQHPATNTKTHTTAISRLKLTKIFRSIIFIL
jgi:hypothetical protein